MKPRIVLYVDYYPSVGGGQVNLLSVFKALDRRRYKPLLVLPEDGPFADRSRALDVPVFFVKMGKARWRRFWEAHAAYSQLKALLLGQKVDLVHANCYPANKLAAPAAKALGIPCIWHKQIAVTQKPGSSTGMLFKFYSRYDSMVLAVSLQAYAGLKALGVPESKLRLLYNNADIRRLAGCHKLPLKESARLGIPKGPPLVLAAGMRRRHKGFDVFLEAAALVKSPCHFALLGDEAPSEEAHEAQLQKLAQNPKLRGRLSVLPAQPDLGPWFKRAAVFVSSSRLEGSPLVVIEAMASGTPIVATVQGSGELIGDPDTGWLAPAGDAPALAAKIDAALASPQERLRRARAAASMARRRFSLRQYMHDLMDLYDGL